MRSGNASFAQALHRRGTQVFLTIWAGQLVSLVGSGMTQFALLVWAWQQGEAATTVALLGFFAHFPYVLASPMAGVVADRFDRRWVMILADLTAALSTVGLLILLVSGQLAVWHLFLAESITSIAGAFQSPAYTAASTLLVPKRHYARASGLNSLALSSSTVLSPILAGLLLALVGLEGVMWVDLATFLIALLTLVIVRLPRPPRSDADPAALTGRGWRQFTAGFRYITARPGLLGLMLMFMGLNFFASLTYFSVLPAMILARTGGDELILGSVQAALGVGGLAGSLILSIWGGPRRRVHAVFLGAAFSFLLGDFLLGTGRSLAVWSVAAFLAAVFIPFIGGAQQAIWQSKVAPEMQGRVFSTKTMLQLSAFSLGFLLAGPLADQLFEPAMAAGGRLAGTFGWLVGTGPGAGIGLMFVCTCILGTAMGLSGYLVPALRHVETDLPDYDESFEPESNPLGTPTSAPGKPSP